MDMTQVHPGVRFRFYWADDTVFGSTTGTAIRPHEDFKEDCWFVSIDGHRYDPSGFMWLRMNKRQDNVIVELI